MHFTNFVGCLTALIASMQLNALPIGFGHNQGSLDYNELVDQDITVYHDARTPNEAQFILSSLRATKPILENWLAVERRRKLPVIMTAEVAGASFANFITDVIELQTAGKGTRDLAWHELTHTIMYEHLLNLLGPAGAIIHLAWMPSWFLEGLAESTSISINSAIQAGFERFQALSGRWPTYESLHSLYSGHTDSYLGYATSGSFVSYLMRHEKLAQNMPRLLANFYDNSMPWMWPWALVPYNTFLPMDDALHEATRKRGRQLYERYKQASKEHWQKNSPGVFLYQRSGSKRNLSFLSRLQNIDNKVQASVTSDGRHHIAEITFDPKTGWAKGYRVNLTMPAQADIRIFSKRERRILYTRSLKNKERRFGFEVFEMIRNTPRVLIQGRGRIIKLFETRSTVSFITHDGEKYKLCSLPINRLEHSQHLPISNSSCSVEIAQPRLVELIGEKTNSETNIISELYLGVSEQSVYGDTYSLIIWSPDSPNREIEHHKFKERPVSVATLKEDFWIAFEGTSFYALRKYKRDLKRCYAQLNLSDIPRQITALPSQNKLVLRLLHGTEDHVLQIEPQKLAPSRKCTAIGQHNSPLLVAVNSPKPVTMAKAFAASDYWLKPIQEPTPLPPLSTPPRKTETRKAATSLPAKLRVRPVFAVPWIAGDSGGYNYGLLSIPLMDEMQNFTAQLTALYGQESRFPTTIISTSYTGLWPEIKFDIFRFQTWNGVYREKEDSPLRSAFLDERGVRMHVQARQLALSSTFNLGIKSSVLKKYQGPSGRAGRLNEVSLASQKNKRFGTWLWSGRMNLTVAPEGLNQNFSYNATELNSELTRRFRGYGRHHRLSLGLGYNITRGKKMRRLRESYRPLRIFIPDGGGGLNNISIPIISGGGLFAATFGDTSARAKIGYSTPLIQNIDSLVRLFYIHELKFSAFLNYGGAWYQEPLPPGAAKLIAAHGYTLDLLFDLKGINFNLGGGTGQVFGDPFEVYFTFGFDQIF